MNQVEQRQISHYMIMQRVAFANKVRSNFSFSRNIFRSERAPHLLLKIILWSFRTAELLLDVSNTDDEYFFCANINQVSCITFCRRIRNAAPCVQRADAVSKISRGSLQAIFLTAFSPRLLHHRFLFRPRFSFRAAVNSYFGNQKSTHTPKNHQLRRL